MKLIFPYSRFEKISAFVATVFLATTISLVWRKGYGMNASQTVIVWPTLMVLLCIACFVQLQCMYAFRKKFNGMRKAGNRLTLLAGVHIITVTGAIIAAFYFTEISFRDNAAPLFTAMYTGLGFTLVTGSMWESSYTYSQWKESIAEKEKLEQLKIEQEFEALKSQVNPHFLFNCFNTLSSLIAEDKKQAELFLNELSKVYRYLLRNNRDGLSTLKTEIGFIQSYYQLLKTRHGDAVQLKIETEKRYDEYLLPSLSLQLLIENAVKHNVLSKTQPLHIDVFTTSGNQLVVTNNLQARTIHAPSEKVGLENIRTKYELLNMQGFEILKDRKSFTVALPLIRNKPSYSKNQIIRNHESTDR